MRIGIDIRCLAEGKRTGVEEYTLALLQALFEYDQENEYILFFNAWRKVTPDFSWLEPYPRVTLKVFRFPNKLLNLSLWYLGFPKLDLLLGGTDVFFMPNLNFSATSQKTQLVVTTHDLSFELFPETFSMKQRFWHFLVNFRQLIRRADRVIAVSQSTKDDLVEEYRVPETKITVVPSGIDQRFRKMDRNDPELMHIKDKYHLPYRFILYLGTFEPRKNIVALIDSYNALVASGNSLFEKYDLVLAGTRGWKCDDVFAAREASPYKEKILLPGFIADEDKVALYNLASVFVYPSLYEGFGFPPLEAMACEIPVITSHSSALPEVVGAAGVMIDPYQPDELYRALEAVLTDHELAQTLSEQSAAQSRQFSWEKTATATLALFRAPGIAKGK
ncbi:MAG: glycosyltransferase family 1 protein [Candidatus Moranbacteria bacterium]|nr:glycosyltransferase family 1 protein [Candidatus Moranbacteria bacterium]